MNKCLKRGNIIIWKERDGTINYGKVWKYVDDRRSYDYVCLGRSDGAGVWLEKALIL